MAGTPQESAALKRSARPRRGCFGRNLGPAFIAGLAATAVSAIGRFGPGQWSVFPPELLAEAAFAHMPLELFQLGIRAFGLYAKGIAFAAAILGWMAAIGLVMSAASRTAGRSVYGSWVWATAAAWVAGIPLLAALHWVAAHVPTAGIARVGVGDLGPMVVGALVVGLQTGRRSRKTSG